GDCPAGVAIDPYGRTDRAWARPFGGDASFRGAPIRSRDEAYDDESAVEPARIERGARHRGDRPGRHAVRRLRPSNDRQQSLQLLQGGRGLNAQWILEGWHPECRRARDARRDGRRLLRERRRGGWRW